MKRLNIHTLILILICFGYFSSSAQTTINVNTLAELRSAVQNSDQRIIMAPGDYNIEVMPEAQRDIQCTGSDNVIILTGVYIEFPVGSSDLAHFLIEGDNVTIQDGEFENTYYNGMTEITDFESYNNDRSRLASGGDPHIKITGNADGTTINGTKMTVRGSFPYGYGSLFGIGGSNTYGLDKRGGIEVRGPNTTIENCEIQMQAFGHTIYIQDPANNTVIKNTLVEGQVRPVADIVAESLNSLPGRNDYKDNDGNDMDPTDVISLCEDGYRVYTGGGSVTLENCVAKKTRGGIRLYLASSATVTNSSAIDCGATNWNMPSNSTVINSSGNFAYAPLSDFRLSKNNQDIEWTIIPSPHAAGPHNLADVLGSGHTIVFHRTPGPLDSDEEREIIIYGDNSTIINETEYTIVLESGADGNEITSCGPVIDNGSGNTVVESANCDFDLIATECSKTAALIEAECYDDSLGIQVVDESVVGYVENGDWALYKGLNLTDMNSVEITYSSQTSGGMIEFRLDALDGDIIGEMELVGTGSWDTWEVENINIDRVQGSHDLYLVFTGGDGYLFDLDKFGFSEDVYCNNVVEYIEAECYDDMFEIQSENCSEGTKNIGWIQDGDWTMYSGIDLTNKQSVKARVSGNTTGSLIQVRLDSENGELIGEIPVTNTGGNQNWVTDSVNIQSTDGLHDVYLVFSGGDGYLFNINHFGFSEESIVVTGTEKVSHTKMYVYPNPARNELYIREVEEGTYELFDHTGTSYQSGKITSQKQLISIDDLPDGIYFVKITQTGLVETVKIIKK